MATECSKHHLISISMDSTRRLSSLCCLFALFLTLFIFFPDNVHGLRGVLKVQRRFARNHPLSELKKHNSHRHATSRMQSSGVASIDIPLGGNFSIGLYYTDITIGTPPKNYTMIVDTGSHLTWVYCKGCIGCPLDDDAAGLHLTPFDPHASKTARNVTDKLYCSWQAELQDMYKNESACIFWYWYGPSSDSKVVGYYFRDVMSYNKVSGDLQTQPAKANVVFGCLTQANISVGNSDNIVQRGIQGLLGLAAHNTSIIPQLAAAGITRNAFAHCLDTVNGGGIFAIGHVLYPKVEKVTPMEMDNLGFIYGKITALDVGGKTIFTPKPSSWAEKTVRFDSGSTLGILVETAYDSLIQNMFADKPGLNVHQDAELGTCFNHSGNVDEEFPTMTFHFAGSATYDVYPHDYVMEQEKDFRCIGWQRGPNNLENLFGDTALDNRLIVYDIENKVIGWTEYNCSSSIKVEDGMGGVCGADVASHAENSPSIHNSTH